MELSLEAEEAARKLLVRAAGRLKDKAVGEDEKVAVLTCLAPVLTGTWWNVAVFFFTFALMVSLLKAP